MKISDKLYTENRGILWGLSYRITGSAAEADDIVQETFLRVMEQPPIGPQDGWKPWLIRVASNLSIDHLRRRKKSYQGSWLPSPLSDELFLNGSIDPKESPSTRYEMKESISLAFLIALEALSPLQRAVLLLREVFDFSTNETSHALNMSVTSVKVTLHRARAAMRSYDQKTQKAVSSSRLRETLKRFLQLLEARDAEGLQRLLTEDVVVVSDGGGEVIALAAPMQGRKNVLQLIIRLNEVYREHTSNTVQLLNGEPAIVFDRSNVRPGHATRFTMHCQLNGRGKITRLNFVFAPRKLTGVRF